MQPILVISSFPPHNSTHHKKLVGVASYAKNTLLALKKHAPGLDITVLAEKLKEEPDIKVSNVSKVSKGANQKAFDTSGTSDTFDTSTITVKRVWSRGLFPFLPLLSYIFTKRSTFSTVVIEFELAMFGNFLLLLFFPLFVGVLRLLGKKVVIVMHQVVTDINTMHGHINIQKNSILSYLINFCIHVFYAAVLALSNTIIVFDDILKKNLASIVPSLSSRIVVIPHGVEEFKNLPTQAEARKKLGIPADKTVLLVFGFLAWYKGTDLVVDEWEKVSKVSSVPDVSKGDEKKTFDTSRLHLILAGGPNPNHLDKPFYRKYIADIEKKAEANDITVTGFVDEKDIPLYFQATDVVLLPYRTLMSSSGPLSLALSFGKPFLLSKELKEVLNTYDVKDIDASQSVYETIEDGIRKTENKKTREELAAISKEIAKRRSWEKIGEKYYELLH